MARPSLTAADVVSALKARHPDGQWAFLAELRVGTGYGDSEQRTRAAFEGKVPNESEQRFDAWAMNCWPSKGGFRCVAYEVKVSRSDFLHELKHPLKRELGLRYSNQFYFAAPKGLIKPSELPEDCGLVEIDSSRSSAITVEAPAREMEPLPPRFVAALARRAGRSLKTPGEVQALESALEAQRAAAFDGQSRAWALSEQNLELERLVGALLDLDGWLYDERRGWSLPGEKRGLSPTEALRVELERLRREVPAIALRLPDPHQLDRQQPGLLLEGRSHEEILDGVRELLYRQAFDDAALLAATVAKSVLLHGHRVFREPGWAAAALTDAVLQVNGYRLARSAAVVSAFVALRDDASGLDWGHPTDEAVAALRRALVPGRADKPLAKRLPTLKDDLRASGI